MDGVGIFGGTFDPIHLGHLRAAEEVREAQGLDEMRLVPAAVPPHKQRRGVTDAEHRRRMAELAVEGAPGFRVSTLELDRPGPSYTIDTLRTLRAELGPEARLVFTLGYDAFRDFHTWKEHAGIFTLCDVVVVTRPPWPTALTREDIPAAARAAFSAGPDRESFRHRSGHALRLQAIAGLDISAADIRARVAAGRSIRFLVPSAVESYIAAHGLYRRTEAH